MVVNFLGSEGIRQKKIDGDGSGIYAYLPTLLIYKTVDFSPIFELEKSKRSSDYQGHYFHRVNEVLINKFSLGSALLELPFFLLAWLASVIFGYPVDGYNIFFQYGIAFAAVFWALIGISFFIKLAKLYKIDRYFVWLTVFGGFFGSNLFYYTFLAPAASHVYSFAMVAIFLFYSRKTFVDYSRTNVILAAFSLGLVVLIRPVNILVIGILPFISGSTNNLSQTVKLILKRKDYLFSILFFVLALSPQLIINYLQTGSLLVYGYKNEGFFFSNPAFLQFLFSYQKGWFIYTPIMLLLIPASIYLWKRSIFELISFVGFFILLVYVFSSWWNWIYGDSFGMRPMVDFYSLFFLVIALFISDIKTRFAKKIIWLYAGLAVFLNLFQTYQYSEGIIHPDSMNKEAYWHVFLKAGDSYKGAVTSGDEYFYGDLSDKPFFSSTYNFEADEKGWSVPSRLFFIPDVEHSCMKLEENAIYSSTFHYQIPEAIVGSRNLYVVFDADYFEPQQNTAIDALFVVDIANERGENLFYKAFRVKRLPDEESNIWRYGHIGFKLPEITSDMSKIKFYIWNKNKQEFYINSLGLHFYTFGIAGS